MSEGGAEGEAPPAPPRVELGTAAITRRRSTALARLSLWGAGLAALATTFIKQAWPAYKTYSEEPIPGFKRAVYNQVHNIEPNAALLKGLAIATALLVSLAFVTYLFTRKKLTHGGVRIEGNAVVIVYSDRPEQRIDIADIVSVVDTAKGAELELASGTRMEIAGAARDALKAELVKRRTKLDRLRSDRGAFELPLRGAITNTLPWVGWFFLVGGWQEAGQAFHRGSYAELVIFGLLTAAWLAVCAWHASPARLAIGADGVCLIGRGKARFISFEKVAAVERTPMMLGLRLTDGSLVVVGRNDEQLAGRLKAAFEGYQSPAREGESSNEHAHVLRRGERSREEWRAQLQKLAHSQDYRADVLDEEALASVVADARVDPEQRVAAALALPKSDEARARIRVAAQSSADDDVQHALEAAALDDLAEAELARAMRRRA